jgi:hypothetical protein
VISVAPIPDAELRNGNPASIRHAVVPSSPDATTYPGDPATASTSGMRRPPRSFIIRSIVATSAAAASGPAIETATYSCRTLRSANVVRFRLPGQASSTSAVFIGPSNAATYIATPSAGTSTERSSPAVQSDPSNGKEKFASWTTGAPAGKVIGWLVHETEGSADGAAAPAPSTPDWRDRRGRARERTRLRARGERRRDRPVVDQGPSRWCRHGDPVDRRRAGGSRGDRGKEFGAERTDAIAMISTRIVETNSADPPRMVPI